MARQARIRPKRRNRRERKGHGGWSDFGMGYSNSSGWLKMQETKLGAAVQGDSVCCSSHDGNQVDQVLSWLTERSSSSLSRSILFLDLRFADNAAPCLGRWLGKLNPATGTTA